MHEVVYFRAGCVFGEAGAVYGFLRGHNEDQSGAGE
jgi:hypothetical protein